MFLRKLEIGYFYRALPSRQLGNVRQIPTSPDWNWNVLYLATLNCLKGRNAAHDNWPSRLLKTSGMLPHIPQPLGWPIFGMHGGDNHLLWPLYSQGGILGRPDTATWFQNPSRLNVKTQSLSCLSPKSNSNIQPYLQHGWPGWGWIQLCDKSSFTTVLLIGVRDPWQILLQGAQSCWMQISLTLRSTQGWQKDWYYMGFHSL